MFFNVSNNLDYYKKKKKLQLDWFDLVKFYGISIIVGYLMPNPFYTHTHTHIYIYIKYMWFVNTFCRCTQLNDQIVLFLKI